MSINREIHYGNEIIVVDFSNCKEDQMIQLLRELRSSLIANNRPELILGIFNDRSFITPGFMKVFKNERREEAVPFIYKQAIIGLSETKMIILKGYNFFFNRDIKAFSSKDEAINFLVSE